MQFSTGMVQKRVLASSQNIKKRVVRVSKKRKKANKTKKSQASKIGNKENEEQKVNARAEEGKNEKVETLAEFLTEINQLSNSDEEEYVFRGQKDEKWELNASATRRIKIGKKEKEIVTDQELVKYSEDLVNKAKTTGHGYDEKLGELNDFELLAKLQHHGAATLLIDFTKSPMIALWFATQSEKVEADGKKVEADGKVFVFEVNNDIGKIRTLSFE